MAGRALEVGADAADETTVREMVDTEAGYISGTVRVKLTPSRE